MDEARRANEGERVSQSKPQRSGIPKSLLRMASHNLSPAGMEPTGVERLRRSPKGEVSGETESIEAHVSAFSRRVSCAPDHAIYPRRESNPHLRFRKPLFYPLNYGDADSGKNRLIEWRWATCCSCPQRFGEGRLCLDSPREGEI
jgi:hypothetical protein